MARSFPADFTALPTLSLTTARPIREGADGTHDGELDLANNVNWLFAHHWSPIAAWLPVQSNPFTTTATTPTMYGAFRRETPTDCGDYEVRVRAKLSGTTDTGKVRLEMATGAGPGAGGSSDSSEGVTIDITGTTTATFTANWTPDTGETVDTLEVHAWLTGSTDTLSIYSIEIYPQEYSTPLDAGITDGGVVPFDTTEVAADEPLTTLQRKLAWTNLDTIREDRGATILSFSDDLNRGSTSQYSTTSADYETVIRVPFQTTFGQTRIRWGLHAYDSGGTCKVKLEVVGGGSVEVTTTTGWASPYSAAEYDWDGDGGALTCNEDQQQEFRVSIKASGGNTIRLMTPVRVGG